MFGRCEHRTSETSALFQYWFSNRAQQPAHVDCEKRICCQPLVTLQLGSIMASPPISVLGFASCLMMSASSRLLWTAVNMAAAHVTEVHSFFQPVHLTYLHFDSIHTSRFRQKVAVIVGSVLRECEYSDSISRLEIIPPARQFILIL